MKKFLNLLCCGILVIGSPANLLLATDYYVDASSAAGGSGSAAAPWTTITEAMNSGSVVAGDVVHVATGTYNTALGESFPIDMVAGTELIGPGDHSAVIENGGHMISLVDDGLGHTTISGMSFERLSNSTASWTSGMINIDPADTGGMIDITNNHFNAETATNSYYTFISASQLPTTLNVVLNTASFGELVSARQYYDYEEKNLLIANNTIESLSWQGIDLSFSDSAQVDFVVMNNTLSGGRISVELEASEDSASWAYGALLVTGLISDNTIDGAEYHALDIELEMTDTDARCRADFYIDNNTITNAQNDGINLSMELTDDDSNIADLTFAVINNTVTGSGDDGLEIWASASSTSSELYVDFDIDNNIFSDNGNDGIYIDMEGDFYESGLVLNADYRIANNTCTGNESDGINISLEHTSSSASSVHHDFIFKGNTLTGNGDSGIWLFLEYSSISSSSVDLVMDFGTVGAPGNNSIHSNLLMGGSSNTGDADGIYISSSSSSSANLAALTFPAYGNAWGSGSIEDNIYHQFDNALRPLVEFESGPPVAPVAVYDAIVAAEDTASIIHVTANDTDANGNLDEESVVITQAPSHGSVSVLSNGKVEYTPNLGWLGADTFNYYVSDTTGLNSNTATVEIMTEGGNAMPGAIYDARETEINQSVTIDVLTNDTDPDGDALNPASVVIEQAPHKGTVVVNADGTVTYTPDGSLPFMIDTTDTFNYSMADVRGARSNVATVEVRITRGAVAGASFGATLAVESLVAGAKARFMVTDAKPGSNVRFAYSTRHGSTATQWGNLELGGKVVQMGTVKAGANGKAVFELTLPASAQGATLWFQALDLGHGLLSNAVSGTVQ